jgi:hypothetical protein
MWYPASRGARLGTGAYILKGSVTTRKAWVQDREGRWKEKAPTRTLIESLRFGFIR